MAENWTCPHCGRPQTATDRDQAKGDITFYMTKSVFGHIGISALAACCANPECMKPTVHVEVRRMAMIRSVSGSTTGRFTDDEPLFSQRLIPESLAKPQPEYIPAPLHEDYTEACRIRDLSPKASATLSRRCIQGMIRDFCGISKGRLLDEINELKKRVDEGKAPKGVSEESVDAIDHIRSLGNIGAHMEKDINLIVPVDPDEAQVLIDLIESLFDEWYVARNKREMRFSRVKSLANEKSKLKADLKAPKPEPKKAD